MKRLMSFRRINRERLSIMTFLQPLRFFFWRCILLPSISYAMIFALANIFLSIEIGVLYVELLNFNQQQIGLQYICMIIGSLIGEVIGGILSDKWMLMKKRRTGIDPQAEFRLSTLR